MNRFYIYMLSNASGMYYVGLTTHLEQIVQKHREKRMLSFEANFAFDRLVYVEETSDIEQAIYRTEELRRATFYQKKKLAEAGLYVYLNPENQQDKKTA